MGQFASFYNTQAWRRLSRWKRAQQPLCEMCLQIGDHTPATAVDHVVPIAVDWDCRLDPDNLASICGPCHSSVKQRQEITGKVVGNDADGEPLDKGSVWWTR